MTSTQRALDMLHAVMRHTRSRETLLKHFATLFSPQLSCMSDRFYTHTQTKALLFKFLDPAQAGQIIPADSRGSYRCAP
jgi:hypothetical protein